MMTVRKKYEDYAEGVSTLMREFEDYLNKL